MYHLCMTKLLKPITALVMSGSSAPMLSNRSANCGMTTIDIIMTAANATARMTAGYTMAFLTSPESFACFSKWTAIRSNE